MFFVFTIYLKKTTGPFTSRITPLTQSADAGATSVVKRLLRNAFKKRYVRASGLRFSPKARPLILWPTKELLCQTPIGQRRFYHLSEFLEGGLTFLFRFSGAVGDVFWTSREFLG